MKKFTFAIFALSLTLPLGAQAQEAGRLTQEQLIQHASDRNICAGNSVVSAGYVSATDNRIAVTCGNAGGTVSQSGGLSGMGNAGVAAAAALAGLGIVALAAGGSSSSSDTQ